MRWFFEIRRGQFFCIPFYISKQEITFFSLRNATKIGARPLFEYLWIPNVFRPIHSGHEHTASRPSRPTCFYDVFHVFRHIVVEKCVHDKKTSIIYASDYLYTAGIAMIGAIYRCCLLENLQPCNFKMLFIGRSNEFISFLSRRLDRWFILRVVMKVEEIWIGDYLPTV